MKTIGGGIHEFPLSLDLAPSARAAGSVVLPGSKSMTNRCLLLAALANGTTELHNVLAADDTDRMHDALATLGVELRRDRASATVVVQGTGGTFPNKKAHLQLGNAGTAFRPLTAALAVLGGNYELRGVARMHERPIGDLVDALRVLGCAIDYLEKNGFPPLAIGPTGATAGTPVSIRGDVSSQFLSALLMALPQAHGAQHVPTTVALASPLISRPYVAITTNLMRRFGVTVASPDAATFVIPAGARYESPGSLGIEGDASAASYFLAAGVIGGGPVRVTGVGQHSIQGDVGFAAVLARLGADIRYGDDWIEARRGAPLAGGAIDCDAIPDAAMTLAITALFATAPTTLQNIGSWRVKETDRIHAMATELAKVGATVAAGPDWLRIDPCAQLHAAAIDTYDDHRIAMCFALLRLAGMAITINDPGCVRKTFPGYFAALQSVAG